jgi:hypothetical protein
LFTVGAEGEHDMAERAMMPAHGATGKAADGTPGGVVLIAKN